MTSGAYAKQAIKRVLDAMGVEIRRTAAPSPRMTMGGFQEHCKRLGFRPGAIFDVGVAAGTYEIYDTFPGVPLVLVEPVPDFEPVGT